MFCIKKNSNLAPIPILLLLFAFSYLTPNTAKGQSYLYGGEMNFEVGLNFGATWFLGDLGGGKGIGKSFIKDTNFQFTKPLVGLYMRYHFNQFLSFGINANWAQLEAADRAIRPRSDASPEFFRYIRNLHFMTNILEAQAVVEFHPINIELVSGDFISAYGMGGIGVFHFDPKTDYFNPQTNTIETVKLQPLGTEGQGIPGTGRSKYQLLEMQVPLAIGVRYILQNKYVFGIEAMHRLTMTDYIDDVSTTYVDPALFYANYETPVADMIAALARRSPEIDPGELYGRITEPGRIRGDSSDRDSFYSITFRVGIMFSGGYMGYRGGCPTF
ncbi:MAG: hypothetical protein AAF502_04760 [Bacteroidota bacterium]